MGYDPVDRTSKPDFWTFNEMFKRLGLHNSSSQDRVVITKKLLIRFEPSIRRYRNMTILHFRDSDFADLATK
jgi:hypothetical protein